METIRNYRSNLVLEFMEHHKLDALLVSNCALGNWSTWLLADEGMPLHLPYNRNNLCFVTKVGDVYQYSAREPHPTDWGKFPVITEIRLPVDLTGGRLGIVNPDFLKKTVRDHLLEQFSGIELVDISDAFHLLKAVKSRDELAGLKTAAEKFELAFSVMPLILTGDPLEREVVVRLRNRLRELDAECEDLATSSMVTLTSSPDGEKATEEPILYPGRRLHYGDRVNVTVNGFMPGGFASALGRCYVLGTPTEETAAYWSLALAAQDLLAGEARPGNTVGEMMKTLEGFLKEHGLAVDSSAQVYGIGASVYEAPRNTDSTRNEPLREGMALVIAPKICPEGKDPYCCMDVFEVTATGARRISNSSRELVILD